MSKPVEFGRKLNLAVTEEQVVTDYELINGNPADSDLLILSGGNSHQACRQT
jgi:hypothetical protein